MAINNWPLDDRPREKLFAKGANQLSDAELIAIFINTGNKGKSALCLARDLLITFGNLNNLLSASKQEICNQFGMGLAKYASLKAAIELAKRYFHNTPQAGEKIQNFTAAKHYFLPKLGDYTQEVFACLFLTSRQQIIAYEELFFGTINESTVYPRQIVKRGLFHNAAKIIFAHNHPSGDATPSEADIFLTKQLSNSLNLIDIQLIDHIIVGKPYCLSMAESGYI